MAISKEDVRHVADLARLALEENTIEALTEDFSNIVELIGRIVESDCATVSLSEERLRRRPDVSTPCGDPLLSEVAPQFKKQLFVVPKMSQHHQSEDKPLVNYTDFEKIELKTGKIVDITSHPKADKLLIVTVDVGEEKPRTIVAGLAAHYPDPSSLLNHTVIVVTNLEPVTLRGVTSEGMILAAGGKSHVGLVTVTGASCPVGQVVR